ncbi:MFS transporter [Thermoactinospora rubra]|uniref:MFS transporter n=1 Tax=Thermoactinospora rubra TaxID=1088767 RepID=UPI000A0F9196|nr:MFS transporter [Thermoactinospora rubra]
MTHPALSAHHAPPDPRRWQALALISVAQFMLILDVTVINVALPDIGTDLGLGRTTLTWAVTAYTLLFGGLMLLGGKLADTFGARRLMLAGLALFTLASLATGLASNAALLIGGRAAQGVGAALLSPAALATVTTIFHGPERNRALGVWAALGGAGSAVGVLLGGALTAGPGWRWVFFVNVPVGIAVLAALPAVLRGGTAGRTAQHTTAQHTTAQHTTARRIDLPGALLVTAATGSLVYGLVSAGETGWTGAATLVPLAAAAVLYGAFALVERAVSAPLMHPRTLTRRPVLAGAFLMLVATGLLIGLFFVGSFYLQHLRGHSALTTGLLFLPVAIGTGVGAHVAGRLVTRLGGRPPAVLGLLLAAGGGWLLTGLTPDADVYTALLPGLVLASAGLGAVFVSATTTALALVPHGEAGLASGLVNTFHELGGAVGVAAISTIAAAGLAQNGVITGFTSAFWAVTGIAGIAALLALVLVPPGRLPELEGPHVH